MRLNILHEYRPSFFQRFKIFATRIFFGPSTVDPARAAFYKPNFFARPFYKLQNYLLRGKSSWSVAERELFAAHTSYHNNCQFCLTVHSDYAVTKKANPKWVEELVTGNADGHSPKLEAMLDFLEKMTRQPWNLIREDYYTLKAAGLTEDAIEEAVMVSVNFNIGSRLSDALGFEIPSPKALKRSKPVLRVIGYTFYT